MLTMLSNILDHFGQNTKGATAIEYALIGGTVSIAIVAGLVIMGGSVGGAFNTVAAAL